LTDIEASLAQPTFAYSGRVIRAANLLSQSAPAIRRPVTPK
jgi:hypothetical protein